MHKAAYKYGLLFSVLFLYAVNNYAQSFSTKLYTTADGLSDNYIFSIYQDSYGYLWIGTANGLNRFDGKNFVTYGLKNGLPSLFVDKVYEDSHHRLWIGTRKGIVELKGDSCYTYPTSDSKVIYFVSGFIEPGNGKLWATTNNGVYEFTNNTWNKVSLYPGKDNANAGTIIQTNDGLYINYDNNTLIHQKKDGSYQVLLSVQTSRPFYSSLFAKNDTVFISTYSGLQYWNGNNWVKRFDDTLSKKFIYLTFPDKNGRFWFGTKEDGVLCIFSSENKLTYLHIPLSFNLVSNFYEDKEKNIWVAGFQGLLKISPSPYRFVALPANEKIHSIRNCIAMPSGKILISGENGELLLIKRSLPGNGLAEIVEKFQLNTTNDFIDYYTFDELQRMWFTTREGRLYRLNEHALADMTSIIHFTNGQLRGIAYDKKRKKLFVCADSVLLTGDENRLDTFFSNTKEFISLPDIVYVNEKDGSLLVQTLEDGIFLANVTGEFHALGKENNFFMSMQSATTTNEIEIWAAHSGKDISRYHWKNSQRHELLEKITEKDGLADNTILDIAFDKEEKLWSVSTKGVTLMQKDHQQKWIHRDFEINESGIATPLSFSKLCEDAEGNMWLSLQDKLIVFNKNNSVLTSQNTNTVIEKILLFDRPTNWEKLTDSLDSYRRIPIDPVLNHDQNTLSIAFNGLLLNSNSPPEYSYRLLHSDTAWSNATASNIVTFYQLNPGNYRFEVRSHIKGFDWSEPTAFSFTIKKAFWETWWFRLAIILLASALIIFIFRYRLNQLKERAAMQNQVREMEMKALKAQMNPHFIHNALNSIQSLIINNRSNEASHYISKFAKLLRQVLENADKNLISLDKELYSLQLYVDLEKLRMNMDINYSEHVDENIIASQIKIPPLILQPFVENALWHGLSNKKGKKNINLSIKEKVGWIICEITDNGIGRKQAAETDKSFPEGSLSKAVNITTQRLVDFNQSAGVEPVSFIDLKNSDEPSGTTVIIRIHIHDGG